MSFSVSSFAETGLRRLTAALFGFVVVSALLVASPAMAQDGQGELESPYLNGTSGERGLWSVMIFGGQLTENELAGIIFPSGDFKFTDTSFLGGAVSKEVFRWRGFSVDLEAGLGYQFGDFRGVDNSAAQVWGAAYFRYDDFPWNHLVHTSVGGSVGLNYISERTAFENFETKVGQTEKLLHYFSPEIAFSRPDDLNNELVIRLQHRSSASGAFGCKGCGSNFVTVGWRHRF